MPDSTQTAGPFRRPTDVEILATLRDGGRTNHLAERFGTMDRRPFL